MEKIKLQNDFKIMLRRVGVLWAFFLSIISAFLQVLSSTQGILVGYSRLIFFFGLSMLITTFIISFFAQGKMNRVLFSSIMSAMGLIPFSMLPLFLSLFYFLVDSKENPYQFLNITLVFLLFLIGTAYSILKLKIRIRESSFIENEFSAEGSKIIMRLPFQTDITSPMRKKYIFIENVKDFLSEKLIFFIAVAYPLQHYISTRSGAWGVPLLISALSLPLALHVFNRMACGAYVWIYTVWRIEKQYKKKVYFQ
ncbi:MAG: hypothetical protein V4754_11550 [Pseudomonadota bacterium]